MTSVKLFVLALLMQAILGVAQAASEPPKKPVARPLTLRLEITQRSKDSESNLALINLTNEGDSAITKITCQLLSSDQQIDLRSLENLSPGQSLAEKINLPPQIVNPYLNISYTYENQECSLMLGIVRPKLEPVERSPLLIPLLTGLFNVFTALGGALLGAWIVNKYTQNREMAKNKFDWSKMLFEKYEGAYRTFLRGWNGSPSSIVLESQFDTMKSNSLVPVTIEKAYSELLTTLKSESSPIQKTEACEAFRHEFDKFVSNPWYT